MTEGLCNQPRIGSRSVGQPKRHLDELILAERGGEGGLFSVSSSDRDSVKGSGTVEG